MSACHVPAIAPSTTALTGTSYSKNHSLDLHLCNPWRKVNHLVSSSGHQTTWNPNLNPNNLGFKTMLCQITTATPNYFVQVQSFSSTWKYALGQIGSFKFQIQLLMSSNPSSPSLPGLRGSQGITAFHSHEMEVSQKYTDVLHMYVPMTCIHACM